MKIDDIIKIKDRNDIVKMKVNDSPGWDFKMDNYCGREFKIVKIFKTSNNESFWIKLEHIPFYVWHIDWLIDIKLSYLPDNLFDI